jgi:uncharacterized protein (DUF362 family)/NAD-dependent dihydropyrimidine dehydrogenase PreA subunit
MNKVGLLKVESYDEKLKENIIKAVEFVGGFDSIIKSRDRVLLKPNFILYNPVDTATNTHPDFIKAVVEILASYNCKITIGDSSMVSAATEIARKLGLYEKLERYGVKFISFKENVPMDLENDPLKNRKYKNLSLAKELKEFDKIINLPKLKSHSQTGITLATKNLYGCVAGKAKLRWHFDTGSVGNFARLIVEISQTVNPDLNILDGIIGMDGNGPSNGRPRSTKVILAGKNCIAVDRVVVELINKRPSQFAIFKAAEDLFLSGTKLDEIQVIGDTIEECKIKDFIIAAIFPIDFIGFHFLRAPFKKLVDQEMRIDYSKCIRCGKCEIHCPAKAVILDETITINKNACIKCCCCQEGCPVGAISVYTPPLGRLIRNIWHR